MHGLGRKCVAAGLLVAAAGCNPAAVRTPNLFHPGPAGPQQLDAIYHDPYPLDDVGPPVVGGRPRGYQRPVPETVRGRLLPAQPSAPARAGFTVPPPTPGAVQPPPTGAAGVTGW